MANTYLISGSRAGVGSVIIDNTGGTFALPNVGIESLIVNASPSITGVAATTAVGAITVETDELSTITGITANVSAGTLSINSYTIPQTAPLPSFAPDNYAQAMVDLLPQGRAWNKFPDSNLYQTIAALIGSYARNDAASVGDTASAFGSSQRATDVLSDTMPYWNQLGAASVYELLDEWELTLGLPDDCAGDNPTIDQRIKSAVARFIALGGQSIAYYKAFANTLGYTITVEEFAPFRADVSVADDTLGDEQLWFTWQIGTPDDGSWLFEADINTSDEALGGDANTVIECEMERVKPAHTVITWDFGSFIDTNFILDVSRISLDA